MDGRMLTFWYELLGETANMLASSPKTSAQFLWQVFMRFLKWYSLSGLKACAPEVKQIGNTLDTLSGAHDRWTSPPHSAADWTWSRDRGQGIGNVFPEWLWEIWQHFSVSAYECQQAINDIRILNGPSATSSSVYHIQMPFIYTTDKKDSKKPSDTKQLDNGATYIFGDQTFCDCDKLNIKDPNQ